MSNYTTLKSCYSGLKNYGTEYAQTQFPKQIHSQSITAPYPVFSKPVIFKYAQPHNVPNVTPPCWRNYPTTGPISYGQPDCIGKSCADVLVGGWGGPAAPIIPTNSFPGLYPSNAFIKL